jgi:UbiD family decarboxylase
MAYKSLQDCITDLEKNKHLIRIKEEVDPYLQMAAIHLRVFENEGPAILFENVKGSKFPAVSNLFGTLDRSRFIFRDTLDKIKTLVDIKNDPIKAIKHPFKYANTALTALSALPMKVGKSAPINFGRTTVGQLPQIVNWPKDGGPFVTMPQVYTEDIDLPGIMNANLGMYRIQLRRQRLYTRQRNRPALPAAPGHRRTSNQGQCQRAAFKSEHICRRPSVAPGCCCDAIARGLIGNDLRRGFGQPPFPLFL